MDTQKKYVLNNGVEMPVLGLGVYKTEDGEETIQSVQYAVEAGYRLIDTAMFYGNEKSVGKGIKQCGVAREEIFVTTKVWNDDVRGGKVKEAFERSLENLGLDYLDMYLIHWPAEGYQEAWRVLEELYEEKRIRTIGVSNFQDYHIEELLKCAKVVPAVNQIECHPRLTQEPLRKYLKSKNILPQAWSPLGRNKDNLFGEDILVALSEKYEKTPAQIILRYEIQNGIAVIPKSAKKERIISNIQVFDFELSKEDMEKISSLNQNLRTGPDPDSFDF
ncbi:diketogulonate reductase-like aldo/keto reductase [Aequitasia blattaphilus]|uniref:Aldo/keto reductase n=1 Tax=Aequitasia blattaphilus TaxID=2949332 RepID=A0ABT1E5T6_9FIRM|nr:aldo/keto reductase [Aequitasia blattaphilus]MCP1101198.1 aldo/keto reductase [Aequitasia blattaphilus]MCR8613838.1 aldo/keto reductase [Aequitasia blattaphilus]